MTALFNPSPLVLSTLQNLSLVIDRSTTLARGPGVAGLSVGRSEARAFGGLDMTMQRTGQSMPAKVRYGAITVAPRAQGSAFSRSSGVHPAIDRAYDNPGVRFGDKVRGGERPTSAAGETSCHFSQTSVSKTSPIREMIRAARGGRRLTGSRAAAHVLYVEREGAPEQIKRRGTERLQGEAFTAEIERRALDRSPVAQQAYIERAGAAEGIERKPGWAITDEELDTLDEASFGTIGETVEERTRFWLAVEEAEATPKGDRIRIKPADNPTWWGKVAKAVDGAPIGAQKPIRDALARNDGEPFELKLPTDKAFALHQWAVGLDTEAPLEISPGRGGRTQTRVIAELPHELDGRERLEIVRDFTQKLAEKGFPYWAVIHAPDANNDARNYHVHIAYYDRPAAKIATQSGKDVWDFEVEEERRYPNRTKHLVRPHQQNRLRETNNQEWVTELRKHWETVSNRVLEEAGVSKRYNLGTYESMGIDLAPLKHINSRTFNKERKGELTEEGPILARRQWDSVHDRMVNDHEARARRREASIVGLSAYAERGARAQPHAQTRVGEIRRLKDLGVKASFQLALLELHQDLTRLVTDRVASRPKLMMQAADKEDAKHKLKSGSAPIDRPIASAGLFGLSRRSEILTFLTTIYDQALSLDRDNGVRAQKARSNVQILVRELRTWATDPGRPLQGVKRYNAEAIQGLAEPERYERRAAAVEALSRGFQDAAKAQDHQILEAIKAAPTSTKPPVSPRVETEVASKAKPRYRPGRPDDQPRAEPPRRRESVLDPSFIAAALGGAPDAHARMTATSQSVPTPPAIRAAAEAKTARSSIEPRGSSIVGQPGAETAQQAPSNPKLSVEPAEQSRADTKAAVAFQDVGPAVPGKPADGTQVVAASPESAPVCAEVRHNEARPSNPPPSERAVEQPVSGIVTGRATAPATSHRAKPVTVDRTANPGVTPPRATTPAPSQGAATPAQAPAAANAQPQLSQAAGVPKPQSVRGHAPEPRTTPPGSSSGGTVERPKEPSSTKPANEPQPVSHIPSLAAVMEEREMARARDRASAADRSRPKPPTPPEPVADKPPVAPQPPRALELDDVVLTGARKLERKKRERERDRGRER